MPTENTQLPEFVLAGLFKETLVIIPDEKKAKKLTDKIIPNAQDNSLSFLGGNQKYITIIVHDETVVHLNEDALTFLQAILGACKLNLGDVAIINTARYKINYQSIKKEFRPKVLLLFGIPADQIALPFTIPYYQLQQYDEYKILYMPDFSTFNGNSQEAKLEKSKLWLSLKKIFEIV